MTMPSSSSEIPAATRFSILAEQTERVKGSSPTQIKQFIKESDSKIASFENEIDALASQIATLTELRERECAAGAALRFLIAPIRTIPVELLAEIFVLTIRESSHIQDAFAVSHVCCHWRQIANNTPRLWTMPMKVSFSRRPQSDEDYAHGLQSWFARSAPLSVPISLTGLRSGMWLSDISPLITAELLHINSRWRCLRFLQRAPGSLVQLLAHGTLDALEELELQQVVADVDDFDPTAVLSFTAAPRLRKLTIDLNCRIPMPWAQLTDISLTNGRSPDHSLDILGQCTSLVRAAVVTHGWSVPPRARAKMLAFIPTCVLYLSLSWGWDRMFMPFLRHVSAPALDSLSLDFEIEDGLQWDDASFTAFQLRAPNVTKLEITAGLACIPSNALRAALLHAPSLTHLWLDDCPNFIDDALIRALCYTEGVPPLVPHLHSLTLTNMSESRVSAEVLTSTIASRLWTDGELALRSKPPAVARWRKIELEGAGEVFSRLGQNFQDAIDGLQTGRVVEMEG
ncbi:hypothetical protein B0H14DRAFT_1469627 [Mycena olivaceomarginata]|nr:hypothetical protein B0H14DRAFT_1469627 [Mycena olivaceomarginata]